jgi:putative transcriptional regulator
MSPTVGNATQNSNDAGSRVRTSRKALGITQQQLADIVDVSRQTIISMETGAYAPSVYLALKVAKQLETTVESLWS